MPSRKQRRRREKAFRHEYGFVTYDEEGNEVEVDPQELRAEKDKPAKAATKSSPSRSPLRGRGSNRTMQPASWRRVGKRGLIFAPIMFLAVAFIDKGRNGYGVYFVQTVFLLAFFLPFSYVMDSFAYRMYLKRTGQLPQREKAKDSKSQATRSPR